MPTSMIKTAFVTGGAHRIGRAIAEDLAANGYAVAIHCHRSRDVADDLADALREQGARAAVVCGDLADLDHLPMLLSEAADALGPIGLLVNNASLFGNDDITSMTPADFRLHMAVNAMAPNFLAQAFAKALPEPAEGLIVNIVDQRVLKPSPGHFSYAASKATLWWTTRTLAQALAPRIRVNAIGPGPTLKGARQSESDFARQGEAVLLKRGPSLDEFGRTVRFLAETPSITGQMIVLDGGQHLAWETPDILGIVE